MNSKIKVGISAKFFPKAPVFYGESNRHIQYIETSLASWVAKNGALPLMLPSETVTSEQDSGYFDAESFAKEMDCLILQGGVDVHPSIYGKTISESQKFMNFDLERDKYELCLINEFIKQRKPIFGICRGLQLLNVYFEGTLFEDLEPAGYSRHFDRNLEENHTHTISINPDSHLGRIYKGNQSVSSVHHQGVDRLGNGLHIEAKSENDGLIEAFSKIDNNHFILAVQWHPEFHNSLNHMNSEKMFKLFLNSAKNRKYFGHLNILKPKTIKMHNSDSLSLGVELELQILNKNTFDLDPSAPKLIKSIEGLTSKVKTEIFQSMIEVETSICDNANVIEADLKESLDILCNEAQKQNLIICSLGTHPFAKYSDRVLTDSDRYRFLIESKQWIARRIAIFGLHCHVGTKNSEEAIQLYRFYLSIAPLLLSISASSPYFQSEDTGLNSVRSTFFESTPAGGHPPIINSWNEFEGLLTKLFKSKAIANPKDLWWDVRPSLNFGTIEIRICDMMPTIKENSCLVALIHFLGHCFLKYQSDYPWPTLSEWSYRENKWRALRYGVGFEFITTDEGNTVNSKEYIKSLASDFSDEIHRLNYDEKMNFLLTHMLEKNPAQRIKEQILSGKTFKEVLEQISLKV